MAHAHSTLKSPQGALKPLSTNVPRTSPSYDPVPIMKEVARRQSSDSMEDFNREFDACMLSPTATTEGHVATAPVRRSDSTSTYMIALDEMPTPDQDESRAFAQRILDRADAIPSRSRQDRPPARSIAMPSTLVSASSTVFDIELQARASLGANGTNRGGCVSWTQAERERMLKRREQQGMKPLVAAEKAYNVDTEGSIASVSMTVDAADADIVPPKLSVDELVRLERAKHARIVQESKARGHDWEQEIKKRVDVQALMASTFDNTVDIKRDTSHIPAMMEQLNRMEMGMWDLAGKYGDVGKLQQARAKISSYDKALNAHRSITEKDIKAAARKMVAPEKIMASQTKAHLSNQNPRSKKAELNHYKNQYKNFTLKSKKKKPFCV